MSDRCRFGRFEILVDQRRLLVDGEPAPLGGRAFDLLAVLLASRERVVPKSELMDRVWPGLVVEENNLQVQVSTLRKLLGTGAIATVPGRGYRWTLAADGDGVPAAAVDRGAPPPGPDAAAALFGRETELDALADRIQEHRLVSLVGAGGVGKTRLARAVLARLGVRFADGAVLIELAPVADPARVADTVARAVGIDPAGRPPAQALADGLAERAMLVVLDNAEHLTDAVGALLAALLPRAPAVHWLITSQQRLRLGAEQLLRLDPLPLPPSAEAAGDSAAVRLFVARVGALQPAFALTPENTADVAEICRLLDGLPLALELGAARVPLLGVAGVRGHLDQCLRLLRGGAREAPARQQSLAATLAWSHGLLEAPAQAVFARLGVFVGGFTLEMAEAVAGDAGIDAFDVVDHLGTLVDHSLVEVGAGERPRYRLLQTMRAFALQQLALAGETEAVRRRHALAVEAFFHEAEDAVLGGRRSRRQALADAAPDLDNLRAAIEWALAAPGETALAARLAGYGHALMYEAGHSKEWYERIAGLADRLDESLPALTRALAWMALGVTGFHAGRPAAQRLQALTRAARDFRAGGDTLRLYGALSVQFMVAGQCRETALVAALEAELAALTTPDWPPVGLRAGVAYHRASALAHAGRLEESLAAYARALPLAEAADNDRRVFTVLIDQGWVLRMLGRLDEAAAHLRALLERGARDGYDAQRIAAIRIQLAATLARLGGVEAALAEGRQALPVLKATMGWYLWGAEWLPILVACGQHAAAMQLLGHFETDDAAAQTAEQARLRAASEAACGAAQVAAWRAAGRTLDAESALRLCETAAVQAGRPAQSPA